MKITVVNDISTGLYNISNALQNFSLSNTTFLTLNQLTMYSQFFKSLGQNVYSIVKVVDNTTIAPTGKKQFKC